MCIIGVASTDHLLLPPIPQLIGRLALDEAFAGLGVGTAMVRHRLATAVEINLSAACKAAAVTALHDRSRTWWLKPGFALFDDDGPQLYLLTADVHKTLGQAAPASPRGQPISTEAVRDPVRLLPGPRLLPELDPPDR